MTGDGVIAMLSCYSEYKVSSGRSFLWLVLGDASLEHSSDSYLLRSKVRAFVTNLISGRKYDR